MQKCHISLLKRFNSQVDTVDHWLEDCVPSHLHILHKYYQAIQVRWQVHYDQLFTVLKLMLWHVVMIRREPDQHELDISSQEIRISLDNEI